MNHSTSAKPAISSPSTPATPNQFCRHCRDELAYGAVVPDADFIIWGKLFPKEALGPVCSEHASLWFPLNQASMYAVYDLRQAREDLPAAVCKPAVATDSTAESLEALIALSKWIDEANSHRDPETVTIHRLFKLTEEAGEVATAAIGAFGSNPRKGVTNGFDEVLDELLDVAITALGAYEHLQGYEGNSMTDLHAKILKVARRANVIPAAKNTVAEDAALLLNTPSFLALYRANHPS